MFFGVEKDGYYETKGNYNFLNNAVSGGFISTKNMDFPSDGIWQPWNPTYKVLLRKKMNPIPMYWKTVESLHKGFPANGQPVGYDLLKGDFVPPYGNGEKPDFVFSVHGEFYSVLNRKVSTVLSFSNEWDGIHEIIFKDKKDDFI